MDIKKFPESFWWLLAAFFFLMLSRFSCAFLILKAKDVGWALSLLPMLIIIKDLINASIAWPSGKYADKISKEQTFLISLVLMILAHLSLGFTHSILGIIVGIVFLGLHMGVSQGLIRALLAQVAPKKLRGTTFAIFSIVSALAIFLANTIAGSLADSFGIFAPFLAGAIFTSLSFAIMYRGFFFKVWNKKSEIKKTLAQETP